MNFGINFVDLNRKNRAEQRRIDNLSPNQRAKYTKLQLNYIGRCEGAENNGEHSLFGEINDIDDIKLLSKNEILSYVDSKVVAGAYVYKTLLTLKQDETEKYGYTTRNDWENLIRKNINTIADEYKIKLEDLDWTASLHTSEGHPHCHLFFWDKNNEVKSLPFVNYNKIKTVFNKEIFRCELEQIYKIQNESKKEISSIVKENLYLLFPTENNRLFDNKVSREDFEDIKNKLVDLYIAKKEEYKLLQKSSWKMQYQTPEFKDKIREVSYSILDSSLIIKKTINSYINSCIEAEKIKFGNQKNKKAIEKYKKVEENSKEFMMKKIDNQILQFLREQNAYEILEKRELDKEVLEKKSREYYSQKIGRDICKLFSDVFNDLKDSSEFQSNLNKKTKLKNLTKNARREFYLRNKNKGLINWEEESL